MFTQVSEPVDSGFVVSLARPGGNITGFQNFEPEMGGKWLGVLKEIAPNVKRVGILFSAAPHTSFFLRATGEFAPSSTSDPVVDIQHELEGPITKYAEEPDSGLIVLPHPRTIANRGLINSLAVRHRLPAIYPYRYFSADGGLIAYGRTDRSMARRSRICRSDPQRRKARRPSRAGANQVRAGDQPQDRQEPRPHGAAGATRAGR